MLLSTHVDMSDSKELAYRYDLFIASDWRDRFDSLIDENIELPKVGRLLEVNCGTGSFAVDLAQKSKGKLEIVGIDPDDERLDLARAKVQIKKLENVLFERALPEDLPFSPDEFDAVVGDASLAQPYEVEEVFQEMVRVARPGALVVLKLATHGSFDEVFSIFWEALFDAGIDKPHWSRLEELIHQRMTGSQAEEMAIREGLEQVSLFSSKEEFLYETGSEFVNAPIIADIFLDEWLEMVPESVRGSLRERLVTTIDRERHDAPFDISIKATVVSGTKSD
jgi:ubiquinone/menaquinone biosynthesis C-methylase UbiE